MRLNCRFSVTFLRSPATVELVLVPELTGGETRPACDSVCFERLSALVRNYGDVFCKVIKLRKPAACFRSWPTESIGLACEGPLERRGRFLVVVLESEQPLFELVLRSEVVGRECLPLNNGEGNLNLIQPTGMDGGVHAEQVRPLRAQVINRLLAAMGRTVVRDPENTACRLVGFSTHDLTNQAIDWSNAGLLFQAAKNLGPMHVPRRQIGPGAFTKVFVFNSDGTTRRRSERRLFAEYLVRLSAIGVLQNVRRSQRGERPLANARELPTGGLPKGEGLDRTVDA